MSKQKKNEIEIPETIPILTKQILNLDDYISTLPYAKQLGTHAIFLNKLKKKSIYKKLLLDTKSKDSHHNFNPQELKEIRNTYLKKLVISNSFYFPKELGLDEYKKPNNTKEEKLNKVLQHLEEIAKKEKPSMDLQSRKTSTINNLASRKESLLENKRKRTDSINDEADKKKKKNQYSEEEEENSIEENYGVAEYNEEEDYGYPDDEDSQNRNYSFDDGGNDDGDYY